MRQFRRYRGAREDTYIANRNWANAGRNFSMHVKPVTLDCNFVVDSTNGNGLGIRNLKGAEIANVFMNTTAGSLPPASPNLGTARTYGLLGATAVTGSTGAGSTVTGNIGVTPGTSITNFPPSTFTGREDIANTAAAQAKAFAQAAYIALQAQTPTGINSELGGQSLAAGTYKATSGTAGTFTLNGTLTLTGSATDIYVFQTTTTLNTGGSSTPIISLGSVKASNIYWVIGSSATLNSSNAGTFQGNIIALTSITDTLGTVANGSLIALNGAVTLSATTAVNVQLPAATPLGGNPNPNPGYIAVQFASSYNRYLYGAAGFVSPLSGTVLTSTVVGQLYVIVSLGTATAAQWLAAGLPAGITPVIGAAFIALATGSIGGSAAVETAGTSGVDHLEVVGDPNTELLSVVPTGTVPGGIVSGGWIFLQALSGGVLTAPADGTVIGLTFIMSDSSVLINGE
jgi:hypothetical protein